MNATQSCKLITSPSCQRQKTCYPSAFLCRTFFPNVCLVAFFVCLLFLSKLYMGDFWAVFHTVCLVCVCEWLCILYSFHRPSVSVFSGCVFLCESVCVCVCVCVCVFVFMLLWVELNPWWSLIPSRGVSLCHDHRESEREGERDECSVTAKRWWNGRLQLP